MSWQVLLGSTVAVAVVQGIVQIVIRVFDRKAKKEDDAAAKQDNETQHEKSMKSAMRLLFQDRIKHLTKKHIDDRYVAAEDLEDLTKMHTSYKNDLNGNGFLDNLMNQVKALPLHK